MRIPSGVTNQYVYFVAVDATDYATRETGLSSFTVYRSRNGAAAAAMTTPTINETDATNMPGVYELLLDEDMTIGSGNDTEAMVFHITHGGMAPVTLEIELYRPKITAGNTLDVTATGAAGIDWGNVENQSTSVNLSATTTNLCNTITTYTGNTVQTGDSFARIGANGASLSAIPWNASWDAEVQSEVNDGLVAYNAVATTDLPTNFADMAITVTTGQVTVGTNNDKTGYSISGSKTTLDALNDVSTAQVADAVWDEAQAPHVSAGTFGIIASEIATIDTVVDGIQTDLDNGTDGLGAIKTAVDAIPTSNPSAASIADAVLDEALSGHVTAGTLGKAIADTETTANNVETDTQDIQSRLPAALVSGRMDSNMSALDDNATAATNLSASALGIVTGACEGTPSTTVIQTDLAESTDDHYIGRVVVFTSGAAANQATDITDYTGSTGTITVTALTTAPSATDTFVIVQEIIMATTRLGLSATARSPYGSFAGKTEEGVSITVLDFMRGFARGFALGFGRGM